MKIKAIQITLIVLLGYALMGSVPTQQAGSTTINDTTISPDFDIDIGGDGGGHSVNDCTWIYPPSSVDINADTFTLEVTVTGDYDMSASTPTTGTFIAPAIFDGPYGEANCLHGQFNYDPVTDTWSLEAGKVYLLVIGAETGSVNGDGDDYTFTITGPGDILINRLPLPQQSPQVGMISISTAQAQPVYESAGGGVARFPNGNEIWLPQDYDGSGSDTHLVMSSADVDGTTWYEIFIGDGLATVWIPATNVTLVE